MERNEQRVTRISWTRYVEMLETMASDLRLLLSRDHAEEPLAARAARLRGHLILPDDEADQRLEAPTEIWGLPRGGLVPAVLLSHRLGLTVTPRNGIILFVDDILDSGRTYELANRGKCLSLAAFLFVRTIPEAIYQPVYFVDRATAENGRLIFPYEESL